MLQGIGRDWLQPPFGHAQGGLEHVERPDRIRRRVAGLGLSAALHLLAIVIGASITVQYPVPSSNDTPSKVAVHMADVHMLSLPSSGSSNDPGAFSEDLGIHLDADDSTLALPGFRIDFGKVVKKAASLFPFLTGRASLEQIVATYRPRERTALANPFGQRRTTGANRAPLNLRAAEMQKLLDRCWSRRDRWQAFQPIGMLTQSHDPDGGDLPLLLRNYVAQDGLQPYVDTRIRDPRLWTQLGLAADHGDFIDFISHYVKANGSTRTTTELLFLLDILAQASYDALTVLLDSDPSHDLQWTAASSRDAYRAVAAIRNYYSAHLARIGLESPEALKAYYDEARLSVLNTILDTTPDGYRASDARLAIGAIEWKRGKREAAIAVWREMTIRADNADTEDESDILEEVRCAAGQPVAKLRINRILERQRSRWISRSFDRLRQFGYRFDTF